MNPAEMLEGMKLDSGWDVVEKIIKRPNATGGFFSTGYRVRHQDGKEGFLKAMDYSNAFDNPDPKLASLLLNQMTDAYLFEKELCDRCRDQCLRRVVHAIASGTVKTNPKDKHSIVEYLIFELADGDVRLHLDTHAQLDLAFTLRTLHNVAAALNQLHLADIAHQDLKPSNVLVFARTKISKIGDLVLGQGGD
jgi:serine/threonine protein kinase